ncbi:MAG TPA: enoyl-CoA hydratase-related protein, partial [Gammaproteobacteria bacterium]|nr:enoyl-CoA hydratase-related protein [Gammaproteobacteria bacterium]
AYSGRRLPAARARELGLVNEVYADQAAMLTEVERLAGEIASKSPLAIAGSKLAMNHARDHSTAESLAYMTVLQSAIFAPAEIGESIRALREQRPPVFADLAADSGRARKP